jgi:mono/diheme cytochrome c family protein
MRNETALSRSALPWARITIVLGLATMPACQRKTAPASAAAQPAVPTHSSNVLWSSKAMDVDGMVHTITRSTQRVTALVFIAPECPISQSYVPYLNDLNARFQDTDEVKVFGVIGDHTITRREAREFSRKQDIKFPVLFDGTGELILRFEPDVTPEAFVIDSDGIVRYRGRIDDTFRAIGSAPREPTMRDLEAAIASVRSGTPVNTARTKAVGCFVERRPQPATYSRAIAQIVGTHCVDCHGPGGNGPFALTTYKDVARRARTIRTVADDREMPPWAPSARVPPLVNERWLSDHELALLREWAEAGSPAGDDAELPPAKMSSAQDWAYGEPDLILKSPPFEVPATGKDIYYSVAFPTLLEEGKTLVAIASRSTAPQTVHHLGLAADGTGAALRRQRAEGGSGYFSDLDAMTIYPPGAYRIGMSFTRGEGGGMKLPSGIGYDLKKGSGLIVNFHYHPTGVAATNETELSLYFTRDKVKSLKNVRLHQYDIDIPAGDRHFCAPTMKHILPATVELHSVSCHMHNLARECRATAKFPDGEARVLFETDRYRWKTRSSYFLVRPMRLPAGTEIEVLGCYDNSAENVDNPHVPPRRVHWGFTNNDEMLIFIMGLVAVDGSTLESHKIDFGSKPKATDAVDEWSKYAAGAERTD